MQKRLGDGYYEQQLIQNQIMQITGNRYLDGYDNDQEQYKALMNAGVEYAKEYQLTPGVALSAEQMSQLTSDMVWLVNQTVTLPDGSQQTVLVPQVYIHAKNSDIAADNGRISGHNVNINLSGDLNNQGQISGAAKVSTQSHNLINEGQISGNDLSLSAKHDINNQGGSIQAGHSASLTAGNNININSSLSQADSHSRESSNHIQGIDRVGSIEVGHNNDNSALLTLNAGNDINLYDHCYHEEKKSGLMGSGGIGFSVGKEKDTTDNKDTT
ncbi:hemagglutinin repeat-containing protein, partial [Neisseriaceae bacterium ESL0693]|nr:hemagglutinin repeat-containing protein [Neisseriaceae bacterium ESL0693]